VSLRYGRRPVSLALLEEVEHHRRLLKHDQHQERPGEPAEKTEKPLHSPLYHSTCLLFRGL
jgi:hypothetical protein